MRYAIIRERIKSITVEIVKDYLPSNYRVVHVDGTKGTVLIAGEDDHGWTLDGYVIPRLQSGLIVAQEVWPMFVGRNDNYPVQMEITPQVMLAVRYPPLLMDLAHQARELYENAKRDLGEDLDGHSLKDLLADNMPEVPLDTLDHVIVAAGLSGAI